MKKRFAIAAAILGLGVLVPSAMGAKTKISIAYWDPTNTKKWAAQFEKLHPDIQVDCINTGYDVYQKLLVMIAGGRTPDIMQIGEVGMPIFTQGGLLRPLDDFAKQDKAFINSFYPMVVDQFKYKGRLYALSPDIEVLGLFYNKDMFAKSGLTAPDKSWKFDTMIEMGKKLRRVGATGKTEQWGVGCNIGWGEWMSMLWSFGGEVVDDYDAPTKSLLDSPAALKTFESIMSWISREQALTPATGNFDAGKAGMAVNMRFAVPGYRAIKKFSWAIAPFPSGPVRRATHMFTAGYGIAKSSKNAKAAWEFVKYLNSDTIVAERQLAGHAVPATKNVFKYIMEKDPKAAAEGTEAFEYMLDYIHPLPKTSKWTRFQQVIEPPVAAMLAGRISPSQALAAMHRDVNTVLRLK